MELGNPAQEKFSGYIVRAYLSGLEAMGLHAKVRDKESDGLGTVPVPAYLLEEAEVPAP